MRLLTHVHCKPTHFIFHSFIATMSYSLQTTFNSFTKDWADKCHVCGTPTRSSSRSNSIIQTRGFFTLKRNTNIHVFLLEHILNHQGLFNKQKTFRRLLQPSSVITKNDPPSYYSWATPCLTIGRVIRRWVRLSEVSC